MKQSESDSDLRRQFEQHGFVLLRGFVAAPTCELVGRYIRLNATADETKNGDGQVPGSHAGYGDPRIESLCEELLPRLEGLIDEELWPTYAYYRHYKTGDCLPPHVDRVACDVSLTVCLDTDQEEQSKKEPGWPIWFRPIANDGRITADKSLGLAIKMRPGDAALYKGCELIHWREPFAGTWQDQAFLHYVRKSVSYSELVKYDGRNSLGQPSSARELGRVERARRIDAFRKWIIEENAKSERKRRASQKG